MRFWLIFVSYFRYQIYKYIIRLEWILQRSRFFGIPARKALLHWFPFSSYWVRLCVYIVVRVPREKYTWFNFDFVWVQVICAIDYELAYIAKLTYEKNNKISQL